MTIVSLYTYRAEKHTVDVRRNGKAPHLLDGTLGWSGKSLSRQSRPSGNNWTQNPDGDNLLDLALINAAGHIFFHPWSRS